MYKKILYAVILLLAGASIQYLNAEQSVTAGNIQWNIWPSSNTWDYNTKGYGCSYHIIDLPHNGSRSLVGRYDSTGDHDTLIYFVLYRCQLLDPTDKGVNPTEDFINTYIHKIYVRNDIRIPLLSIDRIASFCSTHSCDAGWIPISEDSLGTAGFIQDSAFATIISTDSSNLIVNIDSICDSMWAGIETYLAAPINPLLNATSPQYLNNLYGEYRFVINKQDGGIDELKPVFGVYSPFFINIWKNSQTGEVEKWYEYDLEFFPKKLTIYNKQGDDLIKWERPYQYVLTVKKNIPDAYIAPTQSTVPGTLCTWIEDTVVVNFDHRGSLFPIHITDDVVNESRNSYLYGHYILQPGSIHNESTYYSIMDSTHVVGIADDIDTFDTFSYGAAYYIHHSGLAQAFNTTTYPLENTTTHFLAWLPGEIKAYGYNGDVKTADSPPYLFHYVRHNPYFNAEIFNRDSLPWVKVLHSQYYYLVMEVKIVRPHDGKDTTTVYISWVNSSDVANDGFDTLASEGRSWKLWWQDPYVLLGGKYDSLFVDTVSYAFSWKPFIQLHRVGDTLFWNSFLTDNYRSSVLQINYIVWQNANGPSIPIPDTTADTFLVMPGIDSTTCFMFQVQYNDNNLSYTSEPALTWYPILKGYIDNDVYVVTWPECSCADSYEIWWKKDSTDYRWNIDTVYETYYKIKDTSELAVKVRGMNGEMPMAWGIIGHLNPPTQLRANFSWQNRLLITWNDNSNMEDGYLLEYKFDSQTTWIQNWLPANSNSYVVDSSNLSNYQTIYVRVHPILYANPIDKAGDIYIGKGDSISAFIYFRVLADSSYITNDLAGCSIYNKEATLITEDEKVYTLGQNSVVENGKGIESSIDVNNSCNFVTLWNTGDSLLIQMSSDTQSHPIYEVEDSRFQRISGIAVNIDSSSNLHVAALLLDDNPHYIVERPLLLYGSGPYSDIVWDTVFSMPFIKREMDMYGIASTPDGVHTLINYSIDSVLYTCKINSGKVDSIFVWGNYKSIYNPVYWPSTGSFWFAYLDSTNTLGLISIPIDFSAALVSNWKHSLPVEGNVYIAPTISGSYLGVAAPFPMPFSPIGSSSANAVELSLLNYETNDSIHEIRTISINTTERIDNFMGFLSFIEIDTIPDTSHSPIPESQSISIDTIWRGYVSYRGEDSLYHIDSFNVTLGTNSIKGGIQSSQSSFVPPHVDFNRTVLNSKKENLELAIYSPAAQNGSVEIYDITGRKIWHKQLSFSRNSVNRVRISFKRFPQGVYFVRVKMGDTLFTRKILSIR